MSGLTGYLTIGGVDLSNVFLNINGVTQRQSGTNGPALASNVFFTPNMPVLFAAYTDYPSVSGVVYAYAFYNPSLAAGSGMSTPTYIPPLGSGSPFTSIAYFNGGIIQVSTSTSQSYNYFVINLSASNTGFIINNLDLTQRFRNINGFATPVSGSYINSVTTNTFSIPNPNVPYQFIAYSTGATRSGMIAAYVYYSSTVAAVGGVTIVANIGNMGFGLTYSSGTIILTTSSTTTNSIIYNFNTVV
jgi:hypothetical protein